MKNNKNIIFAKNINKNMIVAALAAGLLVLPFLVLEWLNTDGFAQKDFPGAVFGFMWCSAGLFVFTLQSLLKNIAEGMFRNRLGLVVFKIALLIVLALGFVGLVSDQWSCFWGQPNCD